MLLVVGLGNPGERYQPTPHNIGFRVLDQLARSDDRLSQWKSAFEAESLPVTLSHQRVLLLKPQTFMNSSGKSVQKAAAFYKLGVESLLVVHDELDLPPGRVKLKVGGGEAGHNGLRSITQCLGTQQYARLRVGVGRPKVGSPKSFLLSAPPAEALAELQAGERLAEQAVDRWVALGIERAMNCVNGAVPLGLGSG